MEYHDLIVEKRDGVGIVTLNRPEARNALNPVSASSWLGPSTR